MPPVPSRAAWRLTIAAAVLAGLAVAAVSTRTAPETYPVADTATTSIYTLRAGRGELAVGSYSRFGWNHPGPLLYQLLALPYEVSGRREIALKWTALALNLTWLAATLAIVRRRAPRLALAVAVALVPLLWREQRLLIFPWNPVAPVLALPFAIALAADLDARRRWTPALLVATLSFCVQAHAGLAIPVVAIVLAAAIVSFRFETARSAAGETDSKSPGSVGNPGPGGPWFLALAVALTLWAVPLVHETRHGNLAAMARFLLDDAHAHPEWSRALSAGAYMLAGPFLSGWQLLTDEIPRDVPAWLRWLLPAAVIALMATAVRAARRGERYEARFATICAAATASVGIAAHGIVGQLSDYLLLWAAPIGALDTAAIATAMIAAPLRVRIPERVQGALVASFVATWAVIGALRLTGKHAEQARDPTVRALSLDLRNYCDQRRIARPVLGYAPDAWQEAAGIVLQFDKADRPIAVTEDALYLFGPPFARTGRDRDEFYLMPLNGALPAGAGPIEWVTTRGAYRIVRRLVQDR